MVHLFETRDYTSVNCPVILQNDCCFDLAYYDNASENLNATKKMQQTGLLLKKIVFWFENAFSHKNYGFHVNLQSGTGDYRQLAQFFGIKTPLK